MRHTGAALHADPSRVIARLFLPAEERPMEQSRAAALVDRVLALPEHEVLQRAAQLLSDFAGRHRDYPAMLADHATTVGSHVQHELSDARAMVLGASFTAEYAVEGAALCNPSAVLHPAQAGLSEGQARIAVSLRGIGEGHVSCIGFATAVVGPGASWVFQPRGRPIVAPASTAAGNEFTFPDGIDLSQRVLLPASDEERNGMEDARFVRFADADGTVEYRATYTAYDGRQIAPRLLVSPDLRTFRTHRLAGPAARNKGMALFPRLVDGRHLSLCRSDGESTSLTASADGLVWGEPELIQAPEADWELLQVGNCGPPIETGRGWLVLTHGVGPMRTYAIGAILLDLDEPTRVLGKLERPLLQASPDERDGYVPNVVYSCGGVVHDGLLWLPYGIGDARIGVAWAPVEELLAAMSPVMRR